MARTTQHLLCAVCLLRVGSYQCQVASGLFGIYTACQHRKSCGGMEFRARVNLIAYSVRVLFVTRFKCIGFVWVHFILGGPGEN